VSIRAHLVAWADRLQRVQLWLAASALVILMAVTVLDVFLRYLFKSPVRGSYDIVEVMLLVFVFNGMSAAFFDRRNIVIDVIDYAIGPRGAAILIRIADLLSVICLGLLFWAMLGPAVQAYQYGDRKMELSLPLYVMWAVALAAMAGTMFCAIVVMVARPAVPTEGRSE
jgi:TRAP-type C4-dicarboxylate transport system permease small subunit